MKFSFPHLKGYVTLESGNIECHGDPDLIYMKDLKRKAENVRRFWYGATMPDIETLPQEARQIVLKLKDDLGFAYERFSERVLEAMEKGQEFEKRHELWERWVKHHVGDIPGVQEAADFFVELQEHDILKEA